MSIEARMSLRIHGICAIKPEPSILLTQSIKQKKTTDYIIAPLYIPEWAFKEDFCAYVIVTKIKYSGEAVLNPSYINICWLH